MLVWEWDLTVESFVGVVGVLEFFLTNPVSNHNNVVIPFHIMMLCIL